MQRRLRHKWSRMAFRLRKSRRDLAAAPCVLKTQQEPARRSKYNNKRAQFFHKRQSSSNHVSDSNWCRATIPWTAQSHFSDGSGQNIQIVEVHQYEMRTACRRRCRRRCRSLCLLNRGALADMPVAIGLICLNAARDLDSTLP